VTGFGRVGGGELLLGSQVEARRGGRPSSPSVCLTCQLSDSGAGKIVAMQVKRGSRNQEMPSLIGRKRRAPGVEGECDGEKEGLEDGSLLLRP